MLHTDRSVSGFRKLDYLDTGGSGLVGFKQRDLQLLGAHQCIRQQLIVQIHCIPGLVVFLAKCGSVPCQGQNGFRAGYCKFCGRTALHQPGNLILVPRGSAL